MRVGVIGAGRMGQERIRHLKTLDAGQIIVYDTHGGQAAYASATYDVGLAPRLEVLWDFRPGCVFICTSPDAHIDALSLAYTYGVRAMFCEKPLALESVRPRLVAALADCVTMVGCNWRYSDQALAAVRAVYDFPVRSCHLRAAYHLPTVRPDYASTYAVTTGALYDVCWHLVDLALWWFGPATLRDSHLVPADWIRLPDVDGTAHLTLEHTSGVRSYVYGSFQDVGYEVGWELRGEKEARWFGYRQAPGSEMMLRETEHFMSCARSGQQTDNPISQAIEVGRILEEARRRCQR